MTRLFALAPATVLPATLPEMVSIAARAGYDAVGLPLNAAGREGQPDFATLDTALLAETEARLKDAGVTLYDAVGVALRADTDVANYEPLLDTAARLGAAGVMLTVWDEDMVRRAERYADFCERAARRGLDASVEFLPWSALRTIEAAAELVEAAGAANAGIMLDCLHLFRSGGSVEALRPHVGKIRYAQICDAPAVPPLPDDLMAEARQFRRNAGDGELPLGDIFALLPPDLPVSVEGPMQSPLSGLVRAETGLAAAKRVLG